MESWAVSKGPSYRALHWLSFSQSSTRSRVASHPLTAAGCRLFLYVSLSSPAPRRALFGLVGAQAPPPASLPLAANQWGASLAVSGRGVPARSAGPARRVLPRPLGPAQGDEEAEPRRPGADRGPLCGRGRRRSAAEPGTPGSRGSGCGRGGLTESRRCRHRGRGFGVARGREVASPAGSGAAGASKAGRAAGLGRGWTRRPPPELAGLGRSLGVPGTVEDGRPGATTGGRAGAPRLRGGIDAAGELGAWDGASRGTERAAGGREKQTLGSRGVCASLGTRHRPAQLGGPSIYQVRRRWVCGESSSPEGAGLR